MDTLKYQSEAVRLAGAARGRTALITSALYVVLTLAAGPLSDAVARSGEELEELEAALKAEPGSGPVAHHYRLAARSAGRLDEAVAVLDQLVREHPEEVAPRLELALATIDQMGATPASDLARLGALASRASQHLTRILDADLDHWAARYARGMLHLMWPRSARHSRDAIHDFTHLVNLQEHLPVEPYFVLGFIGLGDAYMKHLQPKFAREEWLSGSKIFPDDETLAGRLAMSLDDAEAYVLDTFQLNRPFDTDMSFLWAGK